MKTLIKWLLRTVLLVVVAAGLLVAYVVLFIDPNDYKQTITEQVRNTTELEVSIEGDMSWSFWPSIAIQLESVTIANPPGFGDSPLLKAENVSSSVRLLPLLSGTTDVDHVMLNGATLNLVSNQSGASNLETVLERAASGSVNSDDAGLGASDTSGFSSGQVSLTEVTLNMRDLSTGSMQSVVIEEAVLASLVPGKASRLQLSGSLLDAGEAVIESMQVDGMLTLQGAAGLLSITDLELQARIAGISEPIELAGDLTYGARSSNALRMPDATLKLGEDAFDFRLEVLPASTLSIDFGLTGTTLDLDGLLSAIEAEQSETSNSESNDVDNGGSLDWLKTTRLKGQLSIDSVSYNDNVLDSVTATLNSTDGVLTMTNLSASSFAGNLSASLSIDVNTTPATVVFTPSMTQIDMAQLTEHVTDAAMVRSTGDIGLRLTGRGLDPGGLLSTLGGEGEYDFSEGSLLGVDLTALVESLVAQQSLVGVSGAFDGETVFERMSGSIGISNGELSTPDVNLASDSFAIKGKGTLDLNAATMDYALQVRLLGDLETLFLERYGDYSEAVLPIAISGSLVAPEISFDLNEFLSLNAKARIDREKDEIKDKLRGKLFDSLLGDDDDDGETP